MYLSAFFFGVRQVLRSSGTTAVKALLILVLTGLLAVVSLISLGILLASAGGHNH